MYSKGIFFFLSRTSLNTFSRSIFDKHKIFLTKNMDYPLWKNANFAFFLNRCVYCRERQFYYLEGQQILFLGVFCIKRYVHKILYFCPKPLTKPFLKKANFVGFWNRCFHCPERFVCYSQRRKSFFHDLFPRSIRRLQGVTGGYKGL